MGLYEFLIIDKDGNTLATLDGAYNRFFSIYLNKPGEARFSINPLDPKLYADLFLLGHKELQIKRRGVLVWGGELLYARTELTATGERIELSAKGYLDLLSRRYVGTNGGTPLSYSDDDISTIAHDLVADTQALTNGDFGISAGASPTSRTGDRTYSYKNLLEALQELSNDNVRNGLDFEITPDKTFNTYYPSKGRQLDDVVFEWGVNITEFFQTQDATQMVNQVFVLGSGEGNAMLTATQNASTRLQETYKLRQTVLSHKEVVQVATLQEHGNAEIDEHSVQTQIVGVKTRGDLAPGFGAYQVGDSVRVKVKRGIIAVDGFYRIYGIEMHIGEEDDEEITLIFNQN